jgi:hypothetical protein
VIGPIGNYYPFNFFELFQTYFWPFPEFCSRKNKYPGGDSISSASANANENCGGSV